MMRFPAVLILVCALVAGAAALSRAVRAEIAKGDAYARVLAACMNGDGFTMRSIVVICSPVPIGL